MLLPEPFLTPIFVARIADAWFALPPYQVKMGFFVNTVAINLIAAGIDSLHYWQQFM